MVVALAAHPDLSAMAEGFTHVPLGNTSYLYLVLANIGAVIMPWMIFYQQSAVVDKGLQPKDYRAARWDTAIGAVVTQLIMVAVLIATATTIGKANPNSSLSTVGQIVNALIPYLGTMTGKIIFSVGIVGAGMVSAIVVSLAMAWGFGEVTGYKHSLEQRSREAPAFYLVYSAGVIGGAVLVVLVPDLVTLSIAVQIMNALLLPLVLGLLVALAIKVLPQKQRLHGGYRVLIISIATLVMVIGIFIGLQQLGAIRLR